MVLTPDFFPDGLPPELAREFVDKRLELGEDLARRSAGGDHRIVEGSLHFIQNDRPDAVTAAVRDVVMAVREGKATTRAIQIPSGGAGGPDAG